MEPDPIDQKQVATDFVIRAIGKILSSGSKAVSSYWSRHKARDVSTYADYLVRKAVQANAVRNFIYNTKSASLYDIYVPTLISDGQHTGDRLLEVLCTPSEDIAARTARAFAIIGDAGSGKSLFMKHAFFRIQNINANAIPVLIEVRNFNRLRLADMITRIHSDFQSTGTIITKEQVHVALQSGLFILLLDGFDELKGKIQNHYEAELMDFAREFPLCPILISSRPSPKMDAWSDFEVRRIAPLDLFAATEMISRLEFDADVKAAFIQLLESRLFESHWNFVSVPLLCIIMLLTFADSGYIASYKHEFFENAFNALWSKHDGRKLNFERHRYTKLQKVEFLSLLNAFAMSSYRNADYNMRETQFTEHFSAAVQLSAIKCQEEDFLKDLTVSTSLAVIDGPYIRFCHRSFQEYFAALFVCQVSDEFVGKLVEDISDRIDTDNVLALVLSINAEKIERHWVLPAAEKIAAYIEPIDEKIGNYANAIFIDPSSNVIAIMMNKIRVLYRFDPDSGILKSGYDAARSMSIRLEQLIADAPSQGNIFETDRKNFEALSKGLIKKYQHRSSALDELLGRK